MHDKDTALVRAFLEGKKAERKAIAKWLEDKAYFTLSQLIKANAHLSMDEDDRQRSKEREQKNRAD